MSAARGNPLSVSFPSGWGEPPIEKISICLTIASLQEDNLGRGQAGRHKSGNNFFYYLDIGEFSCKIIQV
jgi:hypothetical protein